MVKISNKNLIPNEKKALKIKREIEIYNKDGKIDKIKFNKKRINFRNFEIKNSLNNIKTNIFFLCIFIILFIPKILSKKNISNLRQLIDGSEIILISKEEISEDLLVSPQFKIRPDFHNITEEILDGETVYKATLKWNNHLDLCSNMFYNLSNIIMIDFSNFEFSGVRDMKNMFRGCTNLKEINFGNSKVATILDMESIFYDCNSLLSLNLSNFDTSKVTTMENLFYGCSSITTLDLSNFNTPILINMGGMFSNCSSLSYLNWPNIDTTTVTNTARMFNGCSSLISLDLSNLKTQNDINMDYMFNDCTNLTHLTFSENFITISAKNMSHMFSGCTKLETVNLSNFMTASVTDMESMFENCEKLLYLDLSNFNTVNVDNMKKMFYGCSSLIYLNLNSSFYMEKPGLILDDIFTGTSNNLTYCAHQQSGRIREILSSKNAQNDCSNICFSEDNNYIYKNACYKDCPKGTQVSSSNELLCVDLNCEYYYNYEQTGCITEIKDGYYLKDEELKTIDKCHTDCKTCDKGEEEGNTNCLICKYFDSGNCVDECKKGYIVIPEINKEKNCYKECDFYYYIDSSNEYKCTEIEECPHGYNKLIREKNKCIDECSKDGDFQYEYNNECYNTCPTDTFENNYICKEKEQYIEKITDEMTISSKETYFTEDIITNGETNINEKTDIGIQSNTFEKIDINPTDDNIKTDLNKKTDINEIEITNTDFNLETEINKNTELTKKTDIIFETEFKEKEITNKIIDKDIETIKEKDKYEDSSEQKKIDIIDNLDAEKFFYGLYNSSELKLLNKDDIIKSIKQDIINHNIDSLLLNVTGGEKKDILIKEDKILYQITTTDNQNNNQYNNVSTIKLGECEDILKGIYGIDKNQSLIIFKVDYYKEGLLIPIIGYEVYDPKNKSKLDLSLCNKTSINYNIPVSINEDNLFKYDPSSEYYNDECNTYTTENGTDILINDRQEEFVDKNMSLCENKCTYIGYDSTTKKALCECGIKYQEFLIEELNNQNNLLSADFTSSNSDSNFATLKCYKVLFTKDGLVSNIASYILLFILLVIEISTFIFWKFGHYLLQTKIKKILHSKGDNRLNRKRVKSSKIKKNNKSKVKNNVANPKRKIKKKSIKTVNSFNKKESFSNSKVIMNTQTVKEENMIVEHKSEKIEIKKVFIDYAINHLTYKEALMYDKRTYLEYYISLIRTKHPIFFTFCLLNDYNILIIKICIFLLSITVYFGINALFFNNTIIHTIYLNEGKYDIVSVLPRIVLSFAISHIINIILRICFLSERELYSIENQKTSLEAERKSKTVLCCFSIKYIIFFAFSNIFLISLWYYLSSFCAIYQNSQIFLLLNTIISYGISLIYPFIINLIPGILRIYSLNDPNRNKYCIYMLSKIIQII